MVRWCLLVIAQVLQVRCAWRDEVLDNLSKTDMVFFFSDVEDLEAAVRI